MYRAIRPDEIGQHKEKVFPSFVFEAFNDLIASNFSAGSSTVKQDEVIDLIIQRSMGIMTRREIFDKGYLNVEETYRAAGWKVEYDKPGYNESYDAFFVFRR